MESNKKESVTTQIHQIYIRATPEAIWSAITTPEWTSQYGNRARAMYDLKPGGAYQSKSSEQMRAMGLPEVIIDGEVVEVNHRESWYSPSDSSFLRKTRLKGSPE